MRFEVTRYEVPETDGFSVERMSGAEANIMIRGKVVNSMADELWVYEVPDLPENGGGLLRIVARTQLSGKHGLEGPRVVREVYVQAVTGGPVREYDWLERGEYEPPAPTHQPVKVGDTVSAMPDGHSLSEAEVTSVEWKVHPMQAHYQLPPLWSWEWRVAVKFPDGRTREGRWHSDWITRA